MDDKKNCDNDAFIIRLAHFLKLDKVNIDRIICDIDDFRISLAHNLKLDKVSINILVEVVLTIIFTLSLFFIFGGNSILGFIFSWVIWEFMIFSFSPESYKIYRRLIVVTASVISFIILEKSSLYIKKILNKTNNKHLFSDISPSLKYKNYYL